MKTVCDVLGVARSAVAVKQARSSDRQDGRCARPSDDTELVAEMQVHVAGLPTHGYRRIWALLSRSRELSGAPWINHKRVYRVMRDPYIDHRTHSFALELGLEPLTTPMRSPQSNRMAESFVKTMKHDYVAYMDKSDAPTALSRLAIAFEHNNERHPHKALKYRSPREFRRAAASLT